MMNNLFKKHGFLMILGCLVPVFVIGFFAIFGINQKSFIILAALACPLSHIVFMRGHEKHNK